MIKFITSIRDVPQKYLPSLQTVPIAAEWQAWIDRQWWGKNNKNRVVGERVAVPLLIRDKLLSFAGSEACMQFEPDDGDNILNRGQFFLGKNANNSKKYKGRASRCHENSSLLWDANRSNSAVHICTGYALSDDGLWRQHTWVVEERPRSWRIYETTTPRVAYYGFVMTREECEEFYDQNT